MCPLKSTSDTLEGVSSFAAPSEGVVALSSLTAACSIYRLCIIERKSISIATAVVLFSLHLRGIFIESKERGSAKTPLNAIQNVRTARNKVRELSPHDDTVLLRSLSRRHTYSLSILRMMMSRESPFPSIQRKISIFSELLFEAPHEDTDRFLRGFFFSFRFFIYPWISSLSSWQDGMYLIDPRRRARPAWSKKQPNQLPQSFAKT